jgi:opacity protein-like surface antigen
MKKAVLASLCLITSVNVFGAEPVEHNGFYLGASVGQASYDLSKDDIGFSGGNLNNSDTAFRLIGGYHINEYFSVEGGYASLGEMTFKYREATSWGGPGEDMTIAFDLGVEVSGLVVNALAQYPLSQEISIFAKVGVFSWEADSYFNENHEYFGDRVDDWNVAFPDSDEADSESGTDIFYGVGLSYSFDNIVIRAEYELFESDGDEIDVLSIGAVYQF